MPSNSTSFEQYHQARVKVTALKDERSSLLSDLEQAQEILVLLLLTTPDPDRIQLVSQLITTNNQKIAALVSQKLDNSSSTITVKFQDISITQQEEIVKKGFDRENGLFVKSLDKALRSFYVERQACCGGTFIGNHVHKALKVCQTLMWYFLFKI